MTLPTHEQAKRKFLEMLNAGEIALAAEFAVKYALVSGGPKKFVDALYKAAWAYRICEIVAKHRKCQCDPKPPFCSLVEDLTCEMLKSTEST